MILKQKKMADDSRSRYQKLEDVVGCKWSVSILMAIGKGINRPGALQRDIEGISVKILSERLRKLTDYGLIAKHSFAEVPPRTEYSLTHYGKQLIRLIEQLQEMDKDMHAG